MMNKIPNELSARFADGEMMRIIGSKRQQTALEYALGVIKRSPVYPFIENLYLYGSCSRASEKWESDVDLFMELSPAISAHDLKIPLRLLKTEVMTDDFNDPEVDLKIVIGPEWRQSDMLFFQNVRKDGILLCV